MTATGLKDWPTSSFTELRYRARELPSAPSSDASPAEQ
jgi:hypothetical protein